MVKRKCKTCGTLFEPKNEGDRYCSSLCRTTGLFVGGGGDTSKPNSTYVPKKMPVKRKAVKSSGTDFPRVREMMKLPPAERWSISKDFTEEEWSFARRLARKTMMDERVVSMIAEWDGEDTGEDSGETSADNLGESDDGSV